MESHQLFMANLSTKCWLLQGGDGRKFSSIFVADSCTAWPGCASSREQREEPCVLTQEQGQETLSPSLLLVLLSLKWVVQNKINGEQRMCAGCHGLCAKHPVVLCTAKWQGQTQLLRVDANCPISASGISFRMEKLSVLQSHLGGLNCWMG